MSEEITTPAAAKPKTPATKKASPKKGVNKTWMIVGVLIVLALGGVNIYYMKKNKELKDKLAALEAAKKKPSTSTSVTPREDEVTDSAPQDREVDTEGNGDHEPAS